MCNNHDYKVLYNRGLRPYKLILAYMVEDRGNNLSYHSYLYTFLSNYIWREFEIDQWECVDEHGC